MGLRFSVSTTYDEKSIRAFCRANYHIYQANTALLITVISIAFIVLGITGAAFFGKSISIAALMIGCIVLANAEYPAHQQAKSILSGFDKKRPELTMIFFEDYIAIASSGKRARLEYSRLNRLSENSEYYFIFLDPNNGYVLQKTGFGPDAASDFREFLQEKTSLHFEQSKNSLMQLLMHRPFEKQK